MSDVVDTIGIEDGSTANEASQGAMEFYRILAEEITPEQLVSIWNKHIQSEEKHLAKLNRQASYTMVSKNFRGLRSRIKSAIRSKLDKVVRIDGQGRMVLVNKAALPLWEEPAKAVVEQPKSQTPKVEALKSSKDEKLSPTEKAILLSTAGNNYGAVTFSATSLPLNQKLELEADIEKALEEVTKESKRQQDFVMWACKLADSELEKLVKKSHGEALWDNAVTVESFPAAPSQKIILVRSSTAPMRTHGPIVKHDYRAYGKAVTIHHDKMLRQLDGQRLIRSKTFKAKAHEYYVKALQYEEGMYFKGYFQVNGEDETSITRYLVVRKGKIVPITEQEYRECENRVAANYAPY